MEKIIFSLRQNVGKEKQKQYKGCLDILETDINKKGSFSHPYSQSTELYKILNENDEFRSGANGKNCDHQNIKSLYRICTIKSILNIIQELNTPIKLKSFFNENHLIPTSSPEEFYEKIKSSFAPGWIAYKDVFEDKFLCWRDFAWWTTENIDQKIAKSNQIDIIKTGHRLGLHNEVLKENFYFLMRLDIDKTNIYEVKIPSVVDAFDNPIFNPMDYDNPSVNAGRTINLEKFADINWNKNIPTAISSGYEEFVVKNIPTNKVMLKVFRVNLAEIMSKENIEYANYNSLLPVLKEFYSLL